MWPRLNVWVMAPGSACRIDDRDGWVVFTADAHGQPFTWKGVDYTAGINTAVAGYVDYEVPPGTYVVWAQRKENGTIVRTHKAVAAVHDEPVVTVRLLPDAAPTEEPKPHECHIQVDDLEGRMTRRSDYPIGLELTGTAEGCSKLRVAVYRTDGDGKTEGEATVQSDGSWVFAFDNEMRLRCGETVLIDATCVEDRKCRQRTEITVRCTEAEQRHE
jgi:hypothetical protein